MKSVKKIVDTLIAQVSNNKNDKYSILLIYQLELCVF